MMVRKTSFKAQQERRKGVPRTDRERFMEHYHLTDEHMDQILKLLGEDIYKLLPNRGEGYTPKKSMLEDAESFRAYQEAWLKSQGKHAVLVT